MTKKQIIALLLTAVFMLSCSSVAFAENEHGAEEHTITFEVPSALVEAEPIGGDSPDIWGQGSYSLENGYYLYSLLFTIPDRYFAYEVSATGAPNGCYSVALVRNVTGLIATIGNYADGSTVKNDWITVTPNKQYQFRIYNYSGATIYITITYYSWP